MLRIRCPECQKLLGIDDSKPVRAIVCPQCKHQFAPEAAITATKRVAVEPAGYDVVEEEQPRVQAQKPSRDDEVLDAVPADERTPKKKSLDFDFNEPAASSRRRPPQPQGGFFSIHGGVAGGLVMMAIAVVWFVAGLFADRIFFYPPVLFVIGLIAVFKGLANQ
jgi:hypothetical protein